MEVIACLLVRYLISMRFNETAFEVNAWMTNRIQQNLGSKVHGANLGPNWGRQGPGGPYVGPMNFAICEDNENSYLSIH